MTEIKREVVQSVLLRICKISHLNSLTLQVIGFAGCVFIWSFFLLVTMLVFIHSFGKGSVFPSGNGNYYSRGNRKMRPITQTSSGTPRKQPMGGTNNGSAGNRRGQNKKKYPNDIRENGHKKRRMSE